MRSIPNLIYLYMLRNVSSCLTIRNEKCAHGELSSHGGIWKTTNELSFEFPSAPFECCSTHVNVVYNCYLIEIRVHAHHGKESPQSAAGDMSSCLYKDGECILQDGSVAISTPDEEEECRFVSVSKMKGILMNSVWLSESKEFALSWSDQSPLALYCRMQLILIDQGYAIAFVRRFSRSADAGSVTSNQLGAQLLAVEGSVHDAVVVLFRHAIQSLCERTNILAISLHAALRTNPTLTMRSPMGRKDISAVHG
ncbi:hypothetical protein V3C99_018791 [Haemonchus contortus]|uniref:UDENN FLCN/SMCR8-type domain-containing protein n=1 Tax=Haemonchus contortus TaxID=6289 RepID=A0A7I4Z1Z0_HAECO